ncbi:hypothetical protein [Halobacterium yunchengense]|uniref:hypothetical protein n=1 Tax=Halobacterium yunchengense TaxID=3108497 RepID=UPI0030097FE1
MTATPDTITDVLHSIEEQHPSWPQTPDNPGETWPRVWDTAVFANTWFTHDDHNDLDEAILHYPFSANSFNYGAARWHRNTKSPEGMVKLHLIRLANGFDHESDFYDYLTETPEIENHLDFDDGFPTRSTLWKAWNDHLADDDDEAKISLQIIANTFIKTAREHNVPAPARAFQPAYDADELSNPDPDNPSVREYADQKTEEVWKEIGPFIHRTYNRCFDREDNASIDAGTFWEGQAYIAKQEDTYPESGLNDYKAETTRENVPCGRYHRDQLRDLPIEDIRRRHRQSTEHVLNRARQNGRLNRPTMASIDITKSAKPLCKLDSVEGWDPNPEKCDVTDEWILGYNDAADDGGDPDINYYYQFAGIRTNDASHPALLDGIPVHRDMARWEIVDELLKHSTDMVDIDILLMDREFDTDEVKAVCLKHGVDFLNPERMFNSEKATCTRLRKQRRMIHVEKKTVDVDDDLLDELLGNELDGMTDDEIEDFLTYTRVYLPAENPDLWRSQIEEIESTSPSSDDDTEQEVPDGDLQSDADIRSEMWGSFASKVLDVDQDWVSDEPPEELHSEREADVRSPFDDLVTDVKTEEEKNSRKRNSDKDKQLFALFATSHSDFPEFDDTEEEEKVEAVESFLKRYNDRWDLEEHWKYVRVFWAETKSRDHQLRFVNFMFACTLYNVWKIIDFLAELSFSDGRSDRPLIRRNKLLVYAKQSLEGVLT